MRGEKLKQAPVCIYQKILDSTEKFLIVRSMFRNEPDTWNFHIKGKIIQIETCNLENPKKFREAYLKAFNIFLPLITKKEWCGLLRELNDDDSRVFLRTEGSGTLQRRVQGDW